MRCPSCNGKLILVSFCGAPCLRCGNVDEGECIDKRHYDLTSMPDIEIDIQNIIDDASQEYTKFTL